METMDRALDEIEAKQISRAKDTEHEINLRRDKDYAINASNIPDKVEELNESITELFDLGWTFTLQDLLEVGLELKGIK